MILIHHLEPFEGVLGMIVNPENSENIINTVELLFTDDFFAYLCQETNRYHDEQEHKYKILKYTLKWIDVIPYIVNRNEEIFGNNTNGFCTKKK